MALAWGMFISEKYITADMRSADRSFSEEHLNKAMRILMRLAVTLSIYPRSGTPHDFLNLHCDVLQDHRDHMKEIIGKYIGTHVGRRAAQEFYGSYRRGNVAPGTFFSKHVDRIRARDSLFPTIPRRTKTAVESRPKKRVVEAATEMVEEPTEEAGGEAEGAKEPTTLPPVRYEFFCSFRISRFRFLSMLHELLCSCQSRFSCMLMTAASRLYGVGDWPPTSCWDLGVDKPGLNRWQERRAIALIASLEGNREKSIASATPSSCTGWRR